MFTAYNLTRIWSIIRENNTSIAQAYKSFIAFIESLLKSLLLLSEQKLKPNTPLIQKNCCLVKTLKIAVGY